MSVTFYIKSKTKKKSPIGASINIKGVKRFVVTIPEEKIAPSEWNEGRVILGRGKQENHRIQRVLDQFKDKIECFQREYLERNSINPSKDEISDYLKSNTALSNYFKPKSYVPIIPIFEDIIKKRSNGEILNKGKIWNPRTLLGYGTTIKSLKEFERHKKFEINNLNVISKTLVLEFMNFLTIKENLKLNTVGARMKNFKALLGELHVRGIITINPFKLYKIPIINEDSDSIALDENELKDMTNLDLSDYPHLDHIRNQFVLLCHLGIRISDFKMFNNLKKDDDVISFKNIKTGETIHIPIFKEAWKILEKYEGHTLKQTKEQNMNEYIKEIGKRVPGLNREFVQEYTKAGVKVTNIKKRYEMLTLHVGRRTAITRLASMGIPAHQIMIISGHKTMKSYEKYIKSNKVDDLRDVIKIVNQRYDEKNDN
jgi:integrase